MPFSAQSHFITTQDLFHFHHSGSKEIERRFQDSSSSPTEMPSPQRPTPTSAVKQSTLKVQKNRRVALMKSRSDMDIEGEERVTSLIQWRKKSHPTPPAKKGKQVKFSREP